MARISTGSLDLGTWAEGEAPGAGSQTEDNPGLNGNWIKIQRQVGTGHNADGTHKNDIIDGPNLRTSVADGASLELTGSPLKLRVKALGITTAMIADDAVTAAKLADDASVDANRAVTTNHIRDAAVTAAKIATDAVTTAKIAGANVTAPKISHDNNRTKFIYTLSWTAVGGYGWSNTVQTSATLGIPMTRAGAITKVAFCSSAGVITSASAPYATSGIKHFNANDRISANQVTPADSFLFVRINGVDTGFGLTGSGAGILSIEVEFDD